MLFVYVTEECRSACTLHAAGDLLQSLKEQVEREQRDDMFHKSPRPFLIKKNFRRRAGRLVAYKEFLELDGVSHAVIVLLTLAMYDGEDFKKNYGNADRAQVTYEQRFKSVIDSIDFKGYVRERLKKEWPIWRVPLSADERFFLLTPVSQDFYDEDDIICESKVWFSSIRNLPNILPRVRDAIEMIHSCGPEGGGGCLKYGVPRSGNGSLKKEITRTDYSVYYQWIRSKRTKGDGIDGETNVLFLCDVCPDGVEPRGVIPKTRLARAKEYYYRAYPSYMLCDDILWSNQQNEKYGNFALSKEESEILHPGNNSQGGNISFPLFVNGRAGSGKSTVLQYLYAEYFVRFQRLTDKWTDDEKKQNCGKILPPAYFACNGSLLANAQEVVGGILCNNPNYDGLEGKWVEYVRPENGKKTLFTEAFRTFRRYLLSLIPAEGAGAFPRIAARWKGSVKDGIHVSDTSFVDYARFVRLYTSKFSRSLPNVDADVSWYLIRTYIKGGSRDAIVADEDELLECLEADLKADKKVYAKNIGIQQIIESGIYKLVFQKVWKEWYEPRTTSDGEDLLWDDQDLARYVLDNGLIEKSPKFMGVFCDESQDFTLLEIKCILKMSVFSNRFLKPHELKLLPFAFAGDEFQTLNPSGFHWSSLQTKFVEGLTDFCASAKFPQINRHDLKYNYRSGTQIVRLSNLVQLQRAIEFQLKDIEPQIPWCMDEDYGKPVVYFPEETTSFWKSFCQQPNLDKAIVVPCLENDEIEYIKKHPCLSFVEIHADGTTEPPVHSVVSVKGLDFECVIVYGFGEEVLATGLNGQANGGAEEVHQMMASYFWNRIYVAVTRPKTLLIVSDTARGYESLWKKFVSCKQVLDKYKDFLQMDSTLMRENGHLEEWEQNILLEKGSKAEKDSDGDSSLLIEGDCENPAGCFEADFRYDPLGTAQKYWNIGLEEHSSKWMAYAAFWFSRCEKTVDIDGELFSREKIVDICHAYALTYDEKYQEAATLFAKHGCYKEACECWWTIGCWQELCQIPHKETEVYPFPFRFQVARACSEGKIESLRQVLKSVLANEGLISDGTTENFYLPEWQNILGSVVVSYWNAKDFDDQRDGELLKQFYNAPFARTIKPTPVICEKLVDRKAYALARDFYEVGHFNLKEIDQQKYRLAHFYSEPYPNMLEWEPTGQEIVETREEVNRQIVSVYQKATDAQRKVGTITEAMRKRIVEAFFDTVGLSEVAVELQTIRDAEWLMNLAKSTRGKSARRALYRAAIISKFEHLSEEKALDCLCNQHEIIRTECGIKFIARLLARMAFAKPSAGEIDWKLFNSRVVSDIDPTDGALLFDEERPEEEYRVAFGRYAKVEWRSKFPGYVSRSYENKDLYDMPFDWDSLRRETLSVKSLSVDAVRNVGGKDVGYFEGKLIVSESDEQPLTKVVRQNPPPVVEPVAVPVLSDPRESKMPISGDSSSRNKYELKLGNLTINYLLRMKRLKFRLEDPLEDWVVDEDGVLVDDEDQRGFVKDVHLRGTDLSLSVTRERVEFQNVRTKSVFIIEF